MFDIAPLDLDKNNDEFFADARTGVTPVDGAGQTVYFRDCDVSVFKSNNVDIRVEERVKCTGQGVVTRGISVLFEGQLKIK